MGQIPLFMYYLKFPGALYFIQIGAYVAVLGIISTPGPVSDRKAVSFIAGGTGSSGTGMILTLFFG